MPPGSEAHRCRGPPTGRRAWRACSPACSTSSAMRPWTCWASPGRRAGPAVRPLSQRDRCRRLVLVATGTGMLMVPGRPGRSWPGWRPPAGIWTRLCRADRRRPLRRDHPGRPRPARALLHGHTRMGRRRGYLYQLGRRRLDQPAAAAWIRQPTLLLAGDDDPIVPLVNAHIMRRLLPHAELHVYHGGHLGLLTEAAQLAPVVDRVLRDGAHPTQGSDPIRGGGCAMPADADFYAPSCCSTTRTGRCCTGSSLHGQGGPADHQPLTTRARSPTSLLPGLAELTSPGSRTPATAAPARARWTAWSPWSWPAPTPRSPPSWASTAGWRWARSTSVASKSRSDAGCRPWPAWSCWGRSGSPNPRSAPAPPAAWPPPPAATATPGCWRGTRSGSATPASPT